MTRINTIVKYIDNKDIVLDIGCDQAEVSISLARRNIKSYASDLRKNIILRAQDKVNKLNLNNYITFFVSDGLKNIPNININTLVLAGMGAHTILNILNNNNFKIKKIITISNNNHDILRYKMNELNYKVELEEIVYEKNKYYNLITFTKGTHNYTKEELLIGLNHQNKKLLKNKLTYDLNKLINISANNLKINEKINIIKNTLNKI